MCMLCGKNSILESDHYIHIHIHVEGGLREKRNYPKIEESEVGSWKYFSTTRVE